MNEKKRHATAYNNLNDDLARSISRMQKENHSWQDQDQPIKSVKWFKKHNAERKAQLAACRSNPSKLAITPNCANASDAD